MILEKLLKNVEVLNIDGNIEVEVHKITCKSKDVDKGSLFFAIKGQIYDGNDFLKNAILSGASVIVTEEDFIECGITVVKVKSVRKSMAIISSNFYSNPEKQLKIVGITGTNGKTTTTFMLSHILSDYGIKTGVIGTLGAFFENNKVETDLTTPDPISLYELLSKMVKAKIEVVVMEVSAHAITHEKIEGIEFFAKAFTNLTQDHLDFYKTMEEYKNAKRKFLLEKNSKYTVINSDDEFGLELIKTNEKSLSYGMENPADVFAIDVTESKSGISFILNLLDEVLSVNLKIYGKFNVSNAMCALEIAVLFGVPTSFAVKSIENFKGVDGRLEKINGIDYNVFVDYAHTPDGLKKSLLALKSITNGRLICLFGCGGNRDRTKRKIMGKISGDYADFSIITSDNPRFEEPMQIIREIENGIREKGNYVLIENRYSAIEYALNFMKKSDVLLIAGKGAEEYQEVLGFNVPFSDKETVEEILLNKE